MNDCLQHDSVSASLQLSSLRRCCSHGTYRAMPATAMSHLTQRGNPTDNRTPSQAQKAQTSARSGLGFPPSVAGHSEGQCSQSRFHTRPRHERRPTIGEELWANLLLRVFVVLRRVPADLHHLGEALDTRPRNLACPAATIDAPESPQGQELCTLKAALTQGPNAHAALRDIAKHRSHPMRQQRQAVLETSRGARCSTTLRPVSVQQLWVRQVWQPTPGKSASVPLPNSCCATSWPRSPHGRSRCSLKRRSGCPRHSQRSRA
mmetsp:Transcript_770/g.3108  ORF Transcript_770/g.3108 Transcript_770/m.3108 type:complete len:262 (+) Transcript_770:636-1421(+)